MRPDRYFMQKSTITFLGCHHNFYGIWKGVASPTWPIKNITYTRAQLGLKNKYNFRTVFFATVKLTGLTASSIKPLIGNDVVDNSTLCTHGCVLHLKDGKLKKIQQEA